MIGPRQREFIEDLCRILRYDNAVRGAALLPPISKRKKIRSGFTSKRAYNETRLTESKPGAILKEEL